MSVKCAMCGKMTKKYITTNYGDDVCEGVCVLAYRLLSYLIRLEERRERDEPNNKRTYQDAREMSAWLTLYRFGNQEQQSRAAAAIVKWSN